MQISPVSNQNAVYEAAANPTAKPTQASSSQSADTVHLSAAARAHISGGDADGDGDGH